MLWLLAFTLPILGATQTCTPQESTYLKSQVHPIRSGGMCVCPSSPDERCPPKGQECGVANGTLPNYYKVVENASVNVDICRQWLKDKSPNQCHLWCARECEADKDCVMWNYHDKHGAKCEFYNHTDVLYEPQCGTGYCIWPELATGCSSRGAATKPEDCCPACTDETSIQVGTCMDDSDSPAVKRTHEKDDVLLASNCSKYCEEDPTCVAWSLVPSTVPDSLRIYQGCYMMNSSWNGKRDTCPYASDSSGCSTRGLKSYRDTCCSKGKGATSIVV